MANGYSVFVGLVIIVILSALAWMFSPKGENQTFVLLRYHTPFFQAQNRLRNTAKLTPDFFSVWRSSLILTFAACYIMWAITLIAQLNPLIAPRRSDLRPEYAGPESLRF
ncbi:H(+)-transporting V0 sector ATPase subunit e [Rhizina undulata]